METRYFLGVDVSKKKLDVAMTIDGKSFLEMQVENTPRAITQWYNGLKKRFCFRHDQLIICMEHTGVYCNPLVDFAQSQILPVAMESALQIKKSQGITRGKNDRIDAKRIAAYAFKNQGQLTFCPTQRNCIKRLKSLLTTRDRLVKAKGELEVAIRECADFIDQGIHREMEKHCKKTLNAIQYDIEQIQKTIQDLVRSDETLNQQYKVVSSVPGIGLITALSVIVTTNEFQKFTSAKKFACYSGVAPFEHTSGTSVRGKTRVSPLANMTIKKLMHLAAMSAVQHSQDLRQYYERKVAEGKNKMSVLNAVRNKLISRMFCCVKHNKLYQKNHQCAVV